ncbi:MAG: hypothetical protein M3Q71_19490 [Chloroflexota bacterium]|nr:hypothetical protein [Chloroflexota bacterium]
MATVREVSEGLMEGRLILEQAIVLLQGVELTSTVGRMSDEDQQFGVDPPVGDDNDVIHLDLALSVHRPAA